jgi:hypothetical protein
MWNKECIEGKSLVELMYDQKTIMAKRKMKTRMKKSLTV